MAIVARALLIQFPQYRDYFDIPAIEIGGRVLKNLNKLLVRYPGATDWTEGGHRLYDESVFEKLKRIQQLRKTKTLSEIRKILSTEETINLSTN